MSKKIKIFVGIFIVFVALGFLGYYYIMNAGARNIETETADFVVKSEGVFAEFTANADDANKKYLDKAIAITGKITAIENNEVTLDDKVNCNFTTIDSALKIGQDIAIKGRVVGFDDLFGSLKLDQCILNKEKK